MKDWTCAPDWLIMTAERRIANGLDSSKKIPIKKEKKKHKTKKITKKVESQKTLLVPFHMTCF
jgi:hypothetical protein